MLLDQITMCMATLFDLQTKKNKKEAQRLSVICVCLFSAYASAFSLLLESVREKRK